MSSRGVPPNGSGTADRDIAQEAGRVARLVVARRGVGGAGRLEGLLAAGAITLVIALGLGLARLDDGAAGSRPPLDRTPQHSSQAALATSTPTPRPTPAVTPATACLALADDRPPVVDLVVAGATGVAGRVTDHGWSGSTAPPDDDGPIPTVDVPFGSPIELEVISGGCARAWDIALTTGDAMGVRSIIERQTNPTMDPRIAAQNRFRFQLTGNGGSWDVAATLTFADGTVDYRWFVGLVGPTTLNVRVR